MTEARAAAFLDRDGTIIHDASYLADPAGVVLLPGAADAIRRLNDVEIPVVVVTNQSGIARGLLTEQQYDAVRARLTELLVNAGAHLDASYMCPHHPDFGPSCECRKPGTLLYRRAAEDLSLNLAESTYIGDRWRDVEPALSLGGHGILIRGSATPADDFARAERETGVLVVDSLAQGVDSMLSRTRSAT